MGVDRVYIAAKRSKSVIDLGFCTFVINVNDINQLVSNLRTVWMGGFHLFADVAKYGRTYNRPVERSGDGKPSVDLWVLPLHHGLQRFIRIGGRGEARVYGYGSDDQCLMVRFVSLTKSLHSLIESFIVSYRNRSYRIIATELLHIGHPILNRWSQLPSPNPLEKEGTEGLVWDENRVLREEDVVGWKDDLVDPLKKGEFVMIRSCDCGNVTTDDNGGFTPVLLLKKTPSLRSIYTPG
ncbi:hypothetical protein Tco_0038309 [Tanacetum coccineum]